MRRTVFLDFEASSLAKTSWPIEVAWVFDDGEEEAHLIRPAPAWTDWAASAERIHHIPLARLVQEGTPHDVVATRMMDQLAGHHLYASAPSWDGKWLSVLLRGAGLPRHALRLEDTVVAHRRLIRTVMEAAGVPEERRATMIRAVLEEADREFTTNKEPAHRALADARHELDLWECVRRIAEEAVKTGAG